MFLSRMWVLEKGLLPLAALFPKNIIFKNYIMLSVLLQLRIELYRNLADLSRIFLCALNQGVEEDRF